MACNSPISPISPKNVASVGRIQKSKPPSSQGNCSIPLNEGTVPSMAASLHTQPSTTGAITSGAKRMGANEKKFFHNLLEELQPTDQFRGKKLSILHQLRNERCEDLGMNKRTTQQLQNHFYYTRRQINLKHPAQTECLFQTTQQICPQRTRCSDLRKKKKHVMMSASFGR